MATGAAFKLPTEGTLTASFKYKRRTPNQTTDVLTTRYGQTDRHTHSSSVEVVCGRTHNPQLKKESWVSIGSQLWMALMVTSWEAKSRGGAPVTEPSPPPHPPIRS